LLYFVAGRVQAQVIGTASKEAILAKLNLLKPTKKHEHSN
jgi:hypothetical protein